MSFPCPDCTTVLTSQTYLDLHRKKTIPCNFRCRENTCSFVGRDRHTFYRHLKKCGKGISTDEDVSFENDVASESPDNEETDVQIITTQRKSFTKKAKEFAYKRQNGYSPLGQKLNANGWNMSDADHENDNPLDNSLHNCSIKSLVDHGLKTRRRDIYDLYTNEIKMYGYSETKLAHDEIDKMNNKSFKLWCFVNGWVDNTTGIPHMYTVVADTFKSNFPRFADQCPEWDL